MVQRPRCDLKSPRIRPRQTRSPALAMSSCRTLAVYRCAARLGQAAFEGNFNIFTASPTARSAAMGQVPNRALLRLGDPYCTVRI